MSTKCIKLRINKPLNCEWQFLAQRLRDLRYQTVQGLNYGMTQYYLWQKEREEYRDAYGKLPSMKELPSPRKHIYHYMNRRFEGYPSNCNAAITTFLNSKWSAECKDVFYKLHKSLSTFKLSTPILCTNQQYKIEHRENEGYVVKVTLGNKEYKKQNGISQFELQVYSARLHNSQKQILNRMINGEYKQGELKIIQDKKDGKKWYLVLAYTFEPKTVELDKNIVCGIDLGVTRPVYCALNSSDKRFYAEDGQELARFRKQIESRRKSYQSQSKTSTRTGRGRKKILEPLKKLQEKVDNFRNTKYHIYTKKIIDFCLNNGAGIIQLEDLSTLTAKKQEDSFLRDWALHSFYEKLEYKAKENNIEIVYTDPQYTSQRCSKCGCINKENRKGVKFKCLDCGYEENSDYNAARNLTDLKINEKIKETLKAGSDA